MNQILRIPNERHECHEKESGSFDRSGITQNQKAQTKTGHKISKPEAWLEWEDPIISAEFEYNNVKPINFSHTGLNLKL